MKDANLIIDHYENKHMLKTILADNLEDMFNEVVKEAKND